MHYIQHIEFLWWKWLPMDLHVSDHTVVSEHEEGKDDFKLIQTSTIHLYTVLLLLSCLGEIHFSETLGWLTNDFVNTCGLQSHEVRQLVYDDLPLCTPFVYSLDAPPLPVSPVNIVTQQGEPKYVRDLVFHQHSPPSAIGIHHLQVWDGREGGGLGQYSSLEWV